MFGFLKNILRKPRETAVEHQAVTSDKQGSALSTYTPAASQVAPSHHAGLVTHSAGKGVEVSLQSIIESLPLELQPRVRQREVGELMISIALEKVLAQLSRGSVRMSFGELRHAAPGVFLPEDDRDKVMVCLPLSEIVPRLNPALIQRRRIQKKVEVPPEIGSPFDMYGQGLVFSVGPNKAEAEPAAPALPPTRKAASAPAETNGSGRLSYSLSPAAPDAPAAPTPLARSSIHSTPAPPAPPALPPEDSLPPAPIPMKPAANKPIPFLKATRPPQTPPPVQPPSAEASPPAPAAPISMNPASIPMNPIPMKPAPGPMSNKGPALTPRVQPVRPLNGNNLNGHHAPAAPAPTAAAPGGTPPPAAPAQPALAPAPAKPAAEPLLVALSALAANWPDEIRKEILLLKLVDAKVGLPVDAIEQALKQGRIVYSWKTLRSWMQPSQTQTVSNQDSTVLELPLQLVAPLFLERQRQTSKTQQKISVDEDIPNLFFGFPQPDAPVGAGAGAEDTNFYVWDDRSDTAMVDRSAEKRPTPGTKFVAKYATPNEVVSRAAALEGVAGSIIALPDGLMVASRLAPDMNGDTLAAFLPHIFGKVSQCTKELRMGELNNLNFTVGNVPWKIFRVNAIFFAAFGTAGKPLPTAQLAALAGDLNHKPK